MKENNQKQEKIISISTKISTEQRKYYSKSEKYLLCKKPNKIAKDIKDHIKRNIDTLLDNPQMFLNSILINTNHTLSSLAEILDIPKRRLQNMNRLTNRDHMKINELRQMLQKNNCFWLK